MFPSFIPRMTMTNPKTSSDILWIIITAQTTTIKTMKTRHLYKFDKNYVTHIQCYHTDKMATILGITKAGLVWFIHSGITYLMDVICLSGSIIAWTDVQSHPHIMQRISQLGRYVPVIDACNIGTNQSQKSS